VVSSTELLMVSILHSSQLSGVALPLPKLARGHCHCAMARMHSDRHGPCICRCCCCSASVKGPAFVVRSGQQWCCRTFELINCTPNATASCCCDMTSLSGVSCTDYCQQKMLQSG
jgi:hypothetical protein